MGGILATTETDGSNNGVECPELAFRIVCLFRLLSWSDFVYMKALGPLVWRSCR